MTLFSDHLTSILAGPLGKDATLTPPGEAAVAIRVLPRGGDFLETFVHAAAIVQAAIFTTAADGLARPLAGAALTIGSANYILLADARADARALSWVMEARPA